MDSVRLVEQREGRNDGQFTHSGRTHDIEVTEVLAPGRKRGDEYRIGRALTVELHDFDPKLGETIARQLANTVQRKAARCYATKPLLLVYVNIGTGGRLSDEVEQMISKLKAEYSEAFAELCVLWRGHLY